MYSQIYGYIQRSELKCYHYAISLLMLVSCVFVNNNCLLSYKTMFDGSSVKFCSSSIFSGLPSINLGLKYQAVPTALKLLKSLATGEQYFTISWLPGGEILASTTFNFEVRNQDLKVLRSVKFPNSVAASRPLPDGSVLSKVKTGSENDKVYLTRNESPAAELLCEVPTFKRSFAFEAKLAIFEKTVAIISGPNDKKHTLKIFSLDEKQLRHRYNIILKLMAHPQGVSIMNDEFEFVTGEGSGELRKYKLKANSAPVWAVTGLHSPYGVSDCPESELIYSSSAYAKRIYVHTSEGKEICHRSCCLGSNGTYNKLMFLISVGAYLK